MKKVSILLLSLMLTLTSCYENYSNGTRIGTITQFSNSGMVFKSWEGHLNVTQTGMNSSEGFDFSIDNDNVPKGIVETIDSAMNNGWKVELDYHMVKNKNWFRNRGNTDHFVTSCRIIDKGFVHNNPSTIMKDTTGSVKTDTIINITVTLKEARTMGWIK